MFYNSCLFSTIFMINIFNTRHKDNLIIQCTKKSKKKNYLSPSLSISNYKEFRDKSPMPPFAIPPDCSLLDFLEITSITAVYSLCSFRTILKKVEPTIKFMPSCLWNGRVRERKYWKSYLTIQQKFMRKNWEKEKFKVLWLFFWKNRSTCIPKS